MHLFISWLCILLGQFYSLPAAAEESCPFFQLSPLGRETSVSLPYWSSHSCRLVLTGWSNLNPMPNSELITLERGVEYVDLARPISLVHTWN